MSDKFYTNVKIAGITFVLETKQPLDIPESFKRFLIEKIDANSNYYKVNICEVEALPEIQTTSVHKDRSYEVFADENNGFVRYFRDAVREEVPFSISRFDWEKRRIDIEYLPKGKKLLSDLGVCFFHLAWEAVLIHENRLILHAACVNTEFGGLLFSGVSGIGKSTQADLWCQYEEGRLLNGDRPVLRNEEDGWYAYGSPYAGSSKCYVNDKCPVKAIVMLQQAERCSLRRLGAIDAFRNIYKGLTINSWDKEYVQIATDMAIELGGDIPVYELACTPDRNAVELLKEELMKTEMGDRQYAEAEKK